MKMVSALLIVKVLSNICTFVQLSSSGGISGKLLWISICSAVSRFWLFSWYIHMFVVLLPTQYKENITDWVNGFFSNNCRCVIYCMLYPGAPPCLYPQGDLLLLPCCSCVTENLRRKSGSNSPDILWRLFLKSGSLPVCMDLLSSLSSPRSISLVLLFFFFPRSSLHVYVCVQKWNETVTWEPPWAHSTSRLDLIRPNFQY